MALAIGGNSVNKAYLGSTEVQKMYLGSELVFTLSDFSIISYNISEETNTTAKVQVYMTEQCSINYYVNGIKNAVSSDDFNAGEIGPDEFRHTRTLTDLPAGQTSNLIIKLTAESNLQVIQSENIPLTTTGEPAGLEIPTGIRLTEPGVPSVDSFPRLINFRVEEVNKDRILFEATADASGLTDQGFLLSTSRTVTEVVLDVGGLSGYLTVSSPYTYWENDKVNLVGGDGTVLDFTYEHILSNIDEPVPTSERFVSVSGGGDGLSIGSPYSFSNIAGDNAEGRKFWIEKGNYGDIWANGTQGRFSSKNGTESAPMWLEGYTNTPGDIAERDILDNFTYTSMAQAEADAFDDTTYPVFAGATEQVSSYGIYFRASSYWIVKNLQIKGFQDNILLGHATGLDAASNIQVRNCSLGLAIGDTGDNIGGGFLSGKGGTTELKSQNTRVTETLCIDNMAHGIRFHGAMELAYDNAVYCGTPAAQYEYTTDYYFSLYGGSENGIVKNNYAARVIGVIGSEYSGHSFGTKGDAGNSNGLFDGNQALNIGENLFAAYIDTYGFVFKNNSVVNVNVSGMEGLVFRDGAHDCIWENNYIEGAGQGCSIWKSRENYPPDVPANDYAARNGIIRNNIFNGGSSLLVSNNKNSIPEPDVDVPHIIENIKFYNNTVYNFTADLFYFNTTNDNDLLTWVDCEFKNNIVHTVANELSTGASTDDYDQQQNLYYNCGFSTPLGAGNVNTPDPDFTDIVGGDFTPLAPFINIQAPRLTDALSGYEWEARQAFTTLGAVLSVEEVPGVVVPTVTVSNTDGTADFSTIQAAIDSGLVAGDVVGLKGGDEFYESVTINALNGVDGNPITFTSYGTGKAAVRGSQSISGWTNEGGGLWSITMSESYQVSKDGVVVTNGRLPLIQGLYENYNNYYSVTSGTGVKNAFQSDDLVGVGSLVGGRVMLQSAPWVLDNLVIATHNDSTGDITTSNESSYVINGGESFFVNAHTNLLTVDDQWCYEGGKLWYKSASEPTGITANDILDNGFTITDSSYLKFSNLEVSEFGVDGFYTDNCSYLEISNNDIKYCYDDAYTSNSSSPSSFITYKDNYIIGSNRGGYSGSDTDNLVEGNRITRIGLLETISQLGGGFNVAIAPRGARVTTRYNNCDLLGYNGVSFDGVDQIIEYNLFKDYCLTLHDGGGIYTYVNTGDVVDFPNDLPAGSEGSVIRYNILEAYDFPTSWYSNGIYLDNASHDIVVEYNSVKNSLNSMVQNTGINNTVRFNTFFNPIEWGYIQNELPGTNSMSTADWCSGNIMSDNIYYSRTVIDDPAISETYENTTVRQTVLYKKAVQGGVLPWEDMFTEIDRNTYVNPYKLTSTFLESEAVPPSGKASWSRPDFATAYAPFDANSEQSYTQWLRYALGSVIGANLVTNGDLEAGTTGWSMQNGTLTLGTDNTNYAIGTATTGYGIMKSPKFTQVAGTKYRIQFDYRTDEANTFQLTVEQSADPWGRFYSTRFDADPTWRTTSFIYDCTEDSTLMEVRWSFGNNHTPLMIDNMSVQEVAESTLPQRDDMVYNYSSVAADVTLPSGTWYTLDGVSHTGTINLQPYESAIITFEDLVL